MKSLLSPFISFVDKSYFEITRGELLLHFLPYLNISEIVNHDFGQNFLLAVALGKL